MYSPSRRSEDRDATMSERRPSGFDRHEIEQRRERLAASFDDRIDWLEGAKRFCCEALGAAIGAHRIPPDRTPLDRLFWLMRLVHRRELSVEAFCREFERCYVLELDRATIGAREATALALVFDRAAWYTPFPRDRRQYPGYVGDAAVLTAVATALGAGRSP